MVSIFGLTKSTNHQSFKKNQSVSVALTRCMGIGKEMSIQICDQCGCSQQIRCHQLSLSQVSMLKEIIHQNYNIEGSLQQDLKRRRTRLLSISAYRGLRYLQGLPCRGQRTHGNARTSRKYKSKKIMSAG